MPNLTESFFFTSSTISLIFLMMKGIFSHIVGDFLLVERPEGRREVAPEEEEDFVDLVDLEDTEDLAIYNIITN